MCIDCDGHHSGSSSFVYVNDFCYYRNCLYTTGTGTALRKNRTMRVPVILVVHLEKRSHTHKPPKVDSTHVSLRSSG